MAYLAIVIFLSFRELITYYRTQQGNKRLQLVYILTAFSVGWAGGVTTFLPPYGVMLYPVWHISICLYALLLTYAIFKYQVLDIRIALTRLMIFVFVYTLVLGIPFMLAFGWQASLKNSFGASWWIVPLIVATVMATIGPYAYIFIQRKSENRLMEEIDKAKEKLFQAEKLAYIGQLASSIIHEIRNPLTSIKTFVQYLPDKVRSNDRTFLEKFETVIPNEINRLEKIVSQLLNLAKPRILNKQTVKLSEIVDATLELLKENINLRNVRLERNYLIKDDLIQGDKEQIQQVLLNLFLNALDAMESGGHLLIKLWREEKEKSRVTLSIKDTGCGIGPEDLTNLFVPFHTTKKNGIGLGLVITQEIIKLHGGEIKVESKPDYGTEFIIDFPALK